MLSFFQKKTRSLAKRVLAGFVNSSDSYIVQHLPEGLSKSPHLFSFLRSLWTQGNTPNKVDLVRLLFLQQAVEEVADIPGAFAELGVYKGNSAKLFHTLAADRRLYLFDTFAGFNPEDLSADPKKKIRADSFLDTSLQAVKSFLGEAPQLLYCPGYFPETASLVAEGETFALVHLDADLYRPTKAALEYFYPRMSAGGMIILHDYSSGAWPGVRQAADAFLKDRPEKLIRIPDKSGTAVFRRYSGKDC